MNWVGSLVCYFVGVIFGVMLGVAISNNDKN